MPGRVTALLALTLAATPFAGGTASGAVLARYSFEDTVATGPDTLAVWQGARHVGTGRGRVALSSAFHVSGYRSVEIKDVSGDGDFPELQGYFPVRGEGVLFFHFAFLTTDPKEELNVALAGPRFFNLEKDGMAFWLGTRAGALVHVSAGATRTLLPVEGFVWYVVDVAYHVGAGTYALTVRREGQPAPLLALRDQPNATGRPGSAVDKFSFVGSPLDDRSNVLYYVDDVVIGTDQGVAEVPFVAPGRRKLFVDRFVEYQGLLRQRPRCLPAASPDDVGLTTADLAALAGQGLLPVAGRLLANERVEPLPAAPTGASPSHHALAALAEWNAGCHALDSGEAAQALRRFERAAAAIPEAWLYRLSAVLALTALKRFGEADEGLALLADWRDDPRYAVASAYVGLARGDLDRAEGWLRDPASQVLDRDANPLLRLFGTGMTADVLAGLRRELGEAFRQRLEETLVVEQYYFVQLWQGRFGAAREYALRMAERLQRARLAASVWRERAGDACFYARELPEAREHYQDAIRRESDHGALMSLYLKLADLAYLAGDVETERALREHYYGALKE